MIKKWWRQMTVVVRMLRRKFSLHTDKLEPHETIAAIKSAINFSGANLWILVFAIFMASLGLNVNSAAVIIGAMLISPLMGPIMGIGLGIGIYDFELIRKSGRNLLVAVVASLVTSTIFFLLTPIKSAGSELLARTSPSVFDVLIAFFGGLAGIVAVSSRFRQSNVIPGVAIATALMPPICTAGYSLANGQMADFMGAFYLFCINSVFISLATILIVRFLKFPIQTYPNKSYQKKLRRSVTAIIILTIIPSVILTWMLVKKYVFNERLQQFLSAEISSEQRFVVSKQVRFRENPKKIELVLIGKRYDSAELKELKLKLEDYQLDNTDLIVRQGIEDTSGQRRVVSKLNNVIENNAFAITNLYMAFDSLYLFTRSQGNFQDSVYATLGKNAKTILPSVAGIVLEPNRNMIFGDSGVVKIDTVWKLTAKVTALPKPAERLAWEQWVQASWPTINWQWVYERKINN